MPSDTIYSLSCRALNQSAVERIYRLKMRDHDKPMIILIASMAQLEELKVDPKQVKLAKNYWPGALTLICQAPKAPEWLHRGSKSLAVRLPDDENLLKLITRIGPLISTSANTQGAEIANSVAEAEQYFGEHLDFYVDAGDLSGRQPSTLAKPARRKLQIIRQGAVEIKEEKK